DALPLTPNGKLDRNALPAPHYTPTTTYRAPGTAHEKILCEVFAQVLDVSHVGLDDNFFELGGHSLLAVTLVERLRSRGVPVNVRALFTAPTVGQLASATAGTAMDARAINVPPNLIPADARAITPDMLPLIDLTTDDINRITTTFPGGAANIADIYPLAPLQQGILFHHLVHADGHDPYVLPTALTFDSRALLDTFLDALQQVIDRHDILRTAVLWEGLPEPVQVVARTARLPIQQYTLTTTDHPMAGLLALCAPSMDLGQAPLLRAHTAPEPGTDRWLLLLQRHHLITDRTALDVLLGEIRAVMEGRPDSLPAPLPFRDFVAQARLGITREEHERFFTDHLAGITEPTAPFGVLDTRHDGTGATNARLPLGPRLAERIRHHARAHHTSPATLIHTAWARVVAATTNRDDVVFGTLLLGRMNAGTGAHRVPGLFINTLPVRFDTSTTTATTAVTAMRDQLADLLTHEHAPLALAQKAGQVDNSAPLFTALLNYRHTRTAQDDSGPGLPGITADYGQDRTNYPLTMSVDDLTDGFTLAAQAIDPIDPVLVCGLLRTALQNLVDALDSAPDTPLHAIGVLDEPIRRQVLEEWNDTAVDVPAGTLPDLFETQAARTPDALALLFEDESVTYAELNARANRLAHLLIDHGVGPETVVPVVMERST
ncbi:condensation domain-containing protein, partial [Kitasatospora sp. NPDC056327]|uniref:condensation domain-containing protein n=1 Tax=Kitasatospora sp. NPDC056327 TaxID=3345785 RepID=UPI0035D9B90A